MDRPRATTRIASEAQQLRSLADNLISLAERLEKVAAGVNRQSVNVSRSEVVEVSRLLQQVKLDARLRGIKSLVDELTPIRDGFSDIRSRPGDY